MSAPTATAVGLLGRLPVRHDARTLSLARYVRRSKLPRAPATLDLTRRVPAWPMYANDRLGDCTCAAAAHMIEAWTAAAGQVVEVSEPAVIVAFEQVKIVDPVTGEEGAVELDVLKFWRKKGIARHRIGAFAAVPLHDRKLVRTSCYLFGGLYIGLSMPLTAQDQEVWDWTGSLTGPARPGSWGGHAVDVVGYSEAGLEIVTWGALKQVTWAFWRRYCDEAYCILSPDFLQAGKAPNGFDLDALRADLELVTA